MQKKDLRKLLLRYMAGDCNEEEVQFLEEMILRDPMPNNLLGLGKSKRMLMLDRAKKEIDKKIRRKKNLRLWSICAGVAAVALVGLFGILGIKPVLLSTTEEFITISDETTHTTEGVTLTLSDGSILEESTLKEGAVQEVDGLIIKRLSNEELSYVYTEQTPQSSGLVNNTIQTPNGRKVQVTLIDGTTIWLNSGSKLTYPIVFSGSERHVTLDGEAYFDVAHNDRKPFKVVANGAEIVVTGTQFNVSAYHSDKTIRTTLVKGGVDVKIQDTEISLTPGYQAVARVDDASIQKHKSNVEQAMAWKNGYFVFDDMDIVSVMNSVSRWYGISVKVKGSIPHKIVGGTFPINADLDELLMDLGKIAAIKFKRNGKEVIIE